MELKDLGGQEEFWPSRRGTGASGLAEYWPSATTRENLEVPDAKEEELRESVDSNNYWVPSVDSHSNYDKMG